MKEEAAVGCCIAALISTQPAAHLSSKVPSYKQQKRTEDKPHGSGNNKDNNTNDKNDDKAARIL